MSWALAINKDRPVRKLQLCPDDTELGKKLDVQAFAETVEDLELPVEFCSNHVYELCPGLKHLTIIMVLRNPSAEGTIQVKASIITCLPILK